MTMTDEEWKEARELVERMSQPSFGVVEIRSRRCDIEVMWRLFPKLVEQRTTREALIAAMPEKLRAVYEAARACWLGLDPRGEKEAALDAALTALESLLPPGH